MRDVYQISPRKPIELILQLAFYINFNIHIQSDEYASCPKTATYSRCYLLGNNIQLSEE